METNILMPCYNTNPEYIEEAIESITSQTYKDWKLIIIDDKSTDKHTLVYLQSMKNHPKIEVVRKSKNTGCFDSRQYRTKFLDKDCKLIAFMDSDDIMLQNRLEKQVDFLEKSPHVDIVGTQIQMWYPDWAGEHIGFANLVTFHPYDVSDYVRTRLWWINEPTVMMRKEVIHKVPLNVGVKTTVKHGFSPSYGGDYVFYLTCWKNGLQIRNMSDVLLIYRVSKSNATSQNQAKITHQTSRLKAIREEVLNVGE